MNAVALYVNTILWLYIIVTYERRGSVIAHKARVMIGQDYSCPCRICHPK